MLILIAIILGTLTPTLIYSFLVWWIDRYEKEPIWLLIISFFWGAIPAVVLSLIFEILFEMPIVSIAGDTIVSSLLSASVSAPIIEESFKALALILLVLIFRKEFDDELDGIVYGAMIGFGFALTENIFYFFSVLSEQGLGAGLVNIFMRSFIFGLNHAFWTACVGASIGFARLSRKISARIFVPFAGWMIAITLHGIHNGGIVLVESTYCLSFISSFILNWGGMVLLFILGFFVLRRESRWIRENLLEEVKKGVIKPEIYDIMSSSPRRMAYRWNILKVKGTKRYREIGRYFQLATDLAFKKHQGDIDCLKPETLYEIRSKLKRLSKLFDP